MSIREFQAASVELVAAADHALVAVQQLRSHEAVPAVADGAGDLTNWDPWG